MEWKKEGVIYSPPFDGSWKDNSALTPTPFLISENVIRVYSSFRDTEGIGRIGYVDVDANNPSKIIKVSSTPVLDIGENGMFDDNGVILGDVIRINDEIYMYYIGFQLVNKVKFLAYTGLAISKDNGENFVRVQKTPVLERSENALFFNAIHTIIFEDSKFKVWCGAGSKWNKINDIFYPNYNVQYYESDDGYTFNLNTNSDCIHHINNEYRIGRPRVYKEKDKYKMIYTYGTLDATYEMGYAESKDGINWLRKDDEMGISLSNDGWDSKSISYGVPIQIKERMFMFYNGNEMGKNGFGYAELVK